MLFALTFPTKQLSETTAAHNGEVTLAYQSSISKHHAIQPAVI